MQNPLSRTSKSSALAFAAGVLVATGGIAAVRPAIATEIAALVTCSSTAACAAWSNTGSGPAVQTTAAKNDGLDSKTSATGKSGLYGETDSTSGGYGVSAKNTSSAGVAIFGAGNAGVGVSATSTGGNAALKAAASGHGGHGAEINSSTSVGAILGSGANSKNGISTELSAGGAPGAIIGGPEIGAEITSGEDGVPLLVQGTSESGGGEVTIDSTGSINATGNIIYGGTLMNDGVTRSGLTVSAYSTRTTQTSVEDSGTALLVKGTAVIALDPLFAQSLDLRTPYRVFLTPDADSHGLYVAQKTATAFVVREMQGGRGSYAFDYRVLGTAAGHGAERMSVIEPAIRARLTRQTTN